MAGGQHHPTHNQEGGCHPAAMPAMLGAVASFVAACVLWTGSRHFSRVRVEGDSMLPAFQTGDRLLIGPAGHVRPGYVIAVADPRSPGRLLVKRVVARTGPQVDVRGDNEGASTDSRHFGPVPVATIAGRVLYRYAPPSRTGWLPH